MKSISEAVEETIKSDLRIYDALSMGIVNNHSLARQIQQEVTRRAGRKAGTSTIAVSIQRIYSKIKSRKLEEPHMSIFSKSRLQLRDDIQILYLNGEAKFTEPSHETIVEASRGFYVKIQGIGTTTVFAGEEELKKMEINPKDVLHKIKDLSAIIITSPPDIVNTPGVIAQLMTALGGSNINVVEVTSSYDNTFLIVEKKDSLKAVEAVRQIIKRSKTHEE